MERCSGKETIVLSRFKGVTIDGILDSHNSELHVTVHSYTHTSVLSVAVSNSRCLVTDLHNEESPASVLTSLLSGENPATELHSAGLGSSLYSLGADPTENTDLNSPSIVVMDGCPAIARISLTCSRAVIKQRLFLLAIAEQQRYYMLQYFTLC
jgi:hypothetical protein